MTPHKVLVNKTLLYIHKDFVGLRAWEIDTGQAYALFSVKRCLQEYKRTNSVTAAMKVLVRIAYGKKGHPDITGIYKGIWIGIEIKTGKDKQRKEQKAFEEMITRAGGVYILLTDKKSIESQLKKLDRIKEWQPM